MPTLEERKSKLRQYRRDWMRNRRRSDPDYDKKIRIQKEAKEPGHYSRYHKEWRRNNSEKIQRASKRYRATNAGTRSNREVSRKYYWKNRARCRARVREWKKRHPAKVIAALLKWKKSNPQSVLDIHARRRARVTNATVEDCKDRIKLLVRKVFCHWCCEPMQNRVTIDHVVPLARGGQHIPDNLVASCARCNPAKRDKLVHEWLDYLLTREAA